MRRDDHIHGWAFDGMPALARKVVHHPVGMGVERAGAGNTTRGLFA